MGVNKCLEKGTVLLHGGKDEEDEPQGFLLLWSLLESLGLLPEKLLILQSQN